MTGAVGHAGGTVRPWLSGMAYAVGDSCPVATGSVPVDPVLRFYRELFRVADKQAADRAAAVALLRFALRIDEPKETPR